MRGGGKAENGRVRTLQTLKNIVKRVFMCVLEQLHVCECPRQLRKKQQYTIAMLSERFEILCMCVIILLECKSDLSATEAAAAHIACEVHNHLSHIFIQQQRRTLVVHAQVCDAAPSVRGRGR